MDTTDLEGVLADAGLSPYQVAAYLAVLERGSATATEIAAASEVPDPRIYDVLRDLEAEGYVETYEQGSLHVRAHDPAAVLADLRGRAERFEDAAAEIEERWERPAPAIESHDASIVSRFETVLDGARRAIEDAADQVQLSVTPGQFDALGDALEDAHGSGVNVRLSVNTDPRTPEALPDPDALAATCTEARHRTLPAPFLVIVDRTVACFAPHPEAADRYGVLVADRTHAYVFHWYFLSCLWEAFEIVYDGRNDDPPIEYVDVRQCIREIEAPLNDGATIHASVEGTDTATGDPLTLAGRVTGVRYAGEPTETGVTPLVRLAGRATIVLDTGTGAEGETHDVGGWGAIVESIEATRVTIERIEGTKRR
jgi:sugar-specific transcriptional regulator TrmB